jgi:hypothetical protein
MESQKEIVALDYQMVRINNVITLRKQVMAELGTKLGDWVVIMPGPTPGTVLLKRQTAAMVDYGGEE